MTYPPQYPPQHPPLPPPPPLPIPAGRRRLGLIIGGLIVAVLVVCGIGAVVVIPRVAEGLGKQSEKGKAAEAQAAVNAADAELERAAERMLTTPAVRFQGSFNGADGRRLTMDVQVTNEGTVRGGLTGSRGAVAVLDLGERTFIKASTAYWRAEGITDGREKVLAARWVRVPGDLFGFDLSDLLAPDQLATGMAPGVDENVYTPPGDTPRLGAVTTVDGVEARTVVVGEVSYLISTAEPKRLLAMSTSPVTGAGGFRTAAHRIGDRELRVKLEALGDAQRKLLFDEVKRRVGELTNAMDSVVQVSLGGKVTLSPCTTNGCTARLDLRSRVTSASKYVVVAKTITVEVEIKMTLDGRPVKTCPLTVTMKPKGTKRVSCPATYYIPPSRKPRNHQVYASFTALARALSTTDAKQMAADLADELKRNGALDVRPPNKPHEYLPAGTWRPALNARQQQARTKVEELARQACKDVPQWPGESATHWGSRVHKRLAELVDQQPPSANLFAEVGYRNGRLANRWQNADTGREGWEKYAKAPDVVFGTDELRPELFLDLKTGAKSLDENWYKDLQRQLPAPYRNVPVLAVRC